ncbi:DarT1-associated NADAR antitoxin family protein [Shewanella atlantica]|uniref:Uncharacterized protein n=1 Tax=Shewanella atlantica TaxID=271099 RepID=A0A3S0KDS4_9GAMM|nr:hypothetical protein [Shewanella atlantica]RTR28526.1 hypothetical protein EKG39_18450 [Shewanella atlantica]
MAVRPIFSPLIDSIGVSEQPIDFHWHSGFAKSQKQKSIFSMHEAARALGFANLLEISSKSENKIGVKLSAFNLMITTKKYHKQFSVESAFQSSKVFESGGPYTDLLHKDSLSAKKDIRLKESGNLVRFRFFNRDFPTTPRTYFYDWVYINALLQNQELECELSGFDGFTDIEFNPQKSINCQAHAIALYQSLKSCNLLKEAMTSPESFLEYTSEHYAKQSRNIGVQQSMV